MKYFIFTLILLVPVAALGQHSHSPKTNTQAPVTLASGLGDVNHPVTTSNAEAQMFFNQGLAYIYAFNHDEAVRSFKRAAELDPQLAMAYWGAALAQGSNYNLQAEGPQLLEAYGNLQKALALAPKASENEQGYINALAKRYSADLQVDRQKLATDYKNAMGQLVQKYPDDLDAATLYAESMMNLRPWKLWTLDGKPAEGTLEIVSVLEGVLRRNPNHTGANHYYIHAVEASQSAERALPSAARLGKLAPKAGHLVHMPSHVYIRTGDYNEAAQSNVDAIAADREYIANGGNQGVYTMMYYNHNIHFLAAASAMEGRYADAIKSARELEASVQPHVKAMPMLEMFLPYATVALVRFGRWDEMLKVAKPDPALKITTAYYHFGRGMAFAGINQIANAQSEYQSLQSVVKTVPADAPLGNSAAVDVLKVADNLLAGKIAFVRGDKKSAVDLFNKAVIAEDAIAYNEPADWDLPVREVFGAVLLLSGDAAAAEKVFRAEIAKHQRNGRGLFGLAESLKAQNQLNSSRMVQVEFERAWATADTKLTIAGLAGIKSESGVSVTEASVPTFATIKLKTGVKLHYAMQGNEDGEPIIMLHGYSDSWFSFSRVMPLLNRRYRVYVLDQRGHGRSDQPLTGYNLPELARDVVAFMDAKGIRRANIVGHSLGSFVAQHVAAMSPDRVQRLVLLGSGTTVRNEAIVSLRNELNGFSGVVPYRFIKEFQDSTVFTPLPEEFMKTVISESEQLSLNTWRQLADGMLANDSNVVLADLKMPVMVLWGEKDTYFPEVEQKKLVKELDTKFAQGYPATGHAPHWEKPAEVVNDIISFMSETGHSLERS
jgi:pimeloyl-ACP methyl ester carboxylesterase/tetratricopeptide (TPR) repeat protein